VILRVCDLHKEFPQPAGALAVLRGVNLVAERGETLAILGESGSGKSTLLALIAGLDSPTRGTIEVAGCDLASLDERRLAEFRARQLGIVFQQYHLLGGLTAFENAALPLELLGARDAESRARVALESVGLAERLDHYPHELSGGECQRVAIARALIVEPALILADEPSGSLDSHTGDAVMALLFDLVAKHAATLVLVTHNDALAARCDRQLVLRGGVLV
jgi:putative ABC transport system ATP-binding protein